MLQSIEEFLTSLFHGNTNASLDADEQKIACAALLVHCANADGDFSEQEDRQLRKLLSGQFDLSDDEVQRIIAIAKTHEQGAVDIHRFTRILHQSLDRDGRKNMVSMLWGMANADGSIDHTERSLISLAAKLLHIEGNVAVALRQDVERGASLEQTEPDGQQSKKT